MPLFVREGSELVVGRVGGVPTVFVWFVVLFREFRW